MMSCSELKDGVQPAAIAGKSEPEHIGHKVGYISETSSAFNSQSYWCFQTFNEVLHDYSYHFSRGHDTGSHKVNCSGLL